MLTELLSGHPVSPAIVGIVHAGIVIALTLVFIGNQDMEAVEYEQT